MLGGASMNEILMVVFLVALIAVAPKVGRIGEVVGGLFERSGDRGQGGTPGAPSVREGGAGDAGGDPEG